MVKSYIEPQVTGDTVVGTFQVGETITGGTSGSTATVDNFFLYDFPAGAAPLENGEIDFFESGSSTVRKTTYSDAAETIPNANPLVIRGDGRVPNVYGSGTYRIVVRTSTGIQILARDPIGGDQGLTFGADWSASIVYSETDVVRDDGRYWQSITANNSGNQPSTDGGVNWIELPFDEISENTANIATNAADIATNTANIATNAADIASIQGLLVTLESYDSGDIAIVSGGAVSLSHGLSVAPQLVLFYLKCNSNDDGYLAGDETLIGLGTQGIFSNNKGFQTTLIDSTNIDIRFGSNTSTFDILNKSTGAGVEILNSSWRFVVRAYAWV